MYSSTTNRTDARKNREQDRRYLQLRDRDNYWRVSVQRELDQLHQMQQYREKKPAERATA